MTDFSKQRIQDRIELTEGFYRDRTNSFLYDKRLLMESTPCEEKTIIEKVIDELFTELNFSTSNTYIKQKKVAVNNLISNIIVATQEGKALAFPRARCKYKNSTFYGFNYFTHTNVVGAAEILLNNGFILVKNGYYDKYKKKGNIFKNNCDRQITEQVR